jgi:pimeloyl-ACP methyl ester carboxylesterase
MFWNHERAMRPYESTVVTNAAGDRVRCFQLKQPGARWNIVFVHGTPANAADFYAQFEKPFPGADLTAVNRPGFGGSKPALEKPSLAVQARALDAVLETLTNHPVILVGHSYGAPVVLWTALEFSNRVAGVLLIGGAIDPSQEHPYWVQGLGDWPVLSWLVPPSIKHSNRELLTLKEDLLELQQRIPALSVPVVMLHGRRDPLVPVANVDYLRRELNKAGKTNLFDALVFPDYNHFIPWDHPEAVARALDMVTNKVERNLRNP